MQSKKLAKTELKNIFLRWKNELVNSTNDWRNVVFYGDFNSRYFFKMKGSDK